MSSPRVALLGIGQLGSACARAVLKGSAPVVLWNRTPARMEEFADSGATCVATVEEAMRLVDVVFVFLPDYESAQQLLEPPAAEGLLADLTVIQMATGTPGKAAALSAWASEQGASYLDGYVHVWPHQIGSETAEVSYAGPRALFDQLLPLLGHLSQAPRFAGEDPGAAEVLGICSNLIAYSSVLGFLEAGALATKLGLTLDDVWRLNREVSLPVIEESIDEMMAQAARNIAGPGEMPVSKHLQVVCQTRQAAAEAGLPTAWSDAICDRLGRAVAEGLGDEELASLLRSLVATSPRPVRPS